MSRPASRPRLAAAAKSSCTWLISSRLMARHSSLVKPEVWGLELMGWVPMSMAWA